MTRNALGWRDNPLRRRGGGVRVGALGFLAAALLLTLPRPALGDDCLPFCPARRDVPGFSLPIIVLSADFLEEGTPDIAVISDAVPGGKGSVSIVQGNVDAGFPILSTAQLGQAPIAAATADFNLDNHADLVVVDFLDENMTVLLGDGAGGFLSQNTFALTGAPVAVAAAEFTGDGKPDLIVATSPLGFAGTLHVYQGDGAGGFTHLTSAGLDVDPRAIVVADFDKDGIPDVAVGHRSSQTIRYFPGTGGGFLGTPVSIPTGASIRALVATDLNNDTKLDLVGGGDTVASSIVPLLGNGSGGFSLMAGVPLGSDVPALGACDYNRDGKVDVIAAEYTADSLGLLKGNGDGSFHAPADLGANSRPNSILTVDLDKDGICDTVSANRAAGTLSIFLADGFGTLGTPQYPSGMTPIGVAAADLNGDGFVDLASVNRDSADVVIMLGNGNGGLTPTQTLAAGTNPGSIAIGDMNGDGALDIAVANQGISGANQNQTVNLYFGDGYGSFPFQTTVTAGHLPLDVVVHDFNADGMDDLAVANGESDTVSVFLATGGGGFAARKNYRTGVQPRTLAVLDEDGDGHPDLAVSQGGDNDIGFLLNDGTGGFVVSTLTLPGTAMNVDDVAAGDLNGDGRDDVVFLNQDQLNTPATVSVYLSDGADGFVEATGSGFQVGNFAEAVSVINLDRMNGLDLVVANRFSDSVGAYLGDGTGGFSYMGDFGTGREPFAMAVKDFNRDGRDDIATADFSGGSVSILLNNTYIDPGFETLHPVDKNNFTWTPVPGALNYRVYRGLTSILRLRDYGTCLTNNAITAFNDPDTPAAGTAFFYLVTPVIGSIEGHMGLDSGCLKRVNLHPCPL